MACERCFVDEDVTFGNSETMIRATMIRSPEPEYDTAKDKAVLGRNLPARRC